MPQGQKTWMVSNAPLRTDSEKEKRSNGMRRDLPCSMAGAPAIAINMSAVTTQAGAEEKRSRGRDIGERKDRVERAEQ